jgi:arsenite-transporting ATPase
MQVDVVEPGGANAGTPQCRYETLHGTLANLTVSRIDPQVETERYRQHVLATRGAALDEEGIALLKEDFRSPCTEEIAVFQAFSRAIREAGRKFVVMDTAPTGHTLLLLDATGAYHREPWAWIINSSVAVAQPHSPLLRQRARNELREIDAVANHHAHRYAVVPCY